MLLAGLAVTALDLPDPRLNMPLNFPPFLLFGAKTAPFSRLLPTMLLLPPSMAGAASGITSTGAELTIALSDGEPVLRFDLNPGMLGRLPLKMPLNFPPDLSVDALLAPLLSTGAVLYALLVVAGGISIGAAALVAARFSGVFRIAFTAAFWRSRPAAISSGVRMRGGGLGAS